MLRRFILRFLTCWLLSALLTVGGCALYPKPDGVGEESVASLTAAEREHRVRALDPQSPQKLIRQTMRELEKLDPTSRYKDSLYALSHHNMLLGNWLVQTPEAWGLPANAVTDWSSSCSKCASSPPNKCPMSISVATTAITRPRHSCRSGPALLVDTIYDIVANAHTVVDILMLQPAAEGEFLTLIRRAIIHQAHSGRAVTMRFLIGQFPPHGSDPLVFLKKLKHGLAPVKNNRLKLIVGVTQSCKPEQIGCVSVSWNHSKIIVADGTTALVGGHNLWSEDYLQSEPVQDLSMRVTGEAAIAAQRFADELWQFVCLPGSDKTINVSYQYAPNKGISRDCVAKVHVKTKNSIKANLPILAIGRLGSGISNDFVDFSLLARDLLLGAARKSIKIVQQDLAFSMTHTDLDRVWPEAVVKQLVKLMFQYHGDVYIVLSNLNAATSTSLYSFGVSIEAVANKIKSVAEDSYRLSSDQLSRTLCEHLHIAALRFGPDDAWPDGKPFAVHAKFWMVDDRLFYVGSENLYPVNLQDFGYVVEEKAASQRVLRDYWAPLWHWSETKALPRSGVSACIWQPLVAHPSETTRGLANYR